jgi:hypothetical protein
MMRGLRATSTIIQNHKGMVTLYCQDDVTYKEKAERHWKRQQAPSVLSAKVGPKLDKSGSGFASGGHL